MSKKRKKVEAVKNDIERPYVYIATPAYDGKVHACYAQSLIEAAQIATLASVRVTGAVIGNSAFIDLSRNMFVNYFLEDNPECTHLFFLDSDLRFEPRAFTGLIAACTKDRPFVAGAYRKRQEEEEYPIKWTPHPEISKEKGESCLWMDNGWLMANRVATGFMCLHRSIVEEMAAKAPKIRIHGQPPLPRLFYTYIDEDEKFVGEDFAFCDDYVKQYGEQIWVWPDFDFEHDGHKGNYQEFLQKSVESYEKESTRRLGAA